MVLIIANNVDKKQVIINRPIRYAPASTKRKNYTTSLLFFSKVHIVGIFSSLSSCCTPERIKK